jgi:hypothetical protein
MLAPALLQLPASMLASILAQVTARTMRPEVPSISISPATVYV